MSTGFACLTGEPFSLGVRALSSFPKGTFVGLYSGELIPEEETDARGEIYNAIERT